MLSALHALRSSALFQELVNYFIISNVGYLTHLSNPFVYGLYFKPVQQLMIEQLRSSIRLKKVNAVVPQP